MALVALCGLAWLAAALWGCSTLSPDVDQSANSRVAARPELVTTAGGDVTQYVLTMASARTGFEATALLLVWMIWRQYRRWRQATHRCVGAIEKWADPLVRSAIAKEGVRIAHPRESVPGGVVRDGVERAIRVAMKNVKDVG
jgi:hypothetical protein